MSLPGAESPTLDSAASFTIFGVTPGVSHARAPRRNTADSQKQGWDSRTKVVPSTAATDTLIRAATARSSHAFSRASSDAGSVIDSVSSTPRGRGPARSQQHTLQAVASRLQHVQSCDLPHVLHKARRNSRAAAPSGCWDSGDCSDAVSWADENLDWKQQHAADVSRHQMESKQALSQLSSAVQQLEEKLHEVMAWQLRSSSLQASACRPHAQSGRHSCSSSIAEGSSPAGQRHSASRPSSMCLEDTVGLDTEQIALANKAKHISQWVQQSTVAEHGEHHEPSGLADVQAEHSIQEPTQEGDTAAALDQTVSNDDQLVSCQLSHQDSTVSVNLCINAHHHSAEQMQQQAARTRYSKWLTIVNIVEDASEQLKVRNHNPGPGSRSVSYAHLLIDCANSESHSESLAA